MFVREGVGECELVVDWDAPLDGESDVLGVEESDDDDVAVTERVMVVEGVSDDVGVLVAVAVCE